MITIELTNEEIEYLKLRLEIFRSANYYSMDRLKEREYSVNNIISLSETELNDRINTQILEKLK